MTIKSKLHGFLSLTAASFALLQNIAASEDKPLDMSADSADRNPDSTITSKTEHLILAPPHQDKLLQLYAGHRSHSSHSSHYSGASSGHSSHTSHYSSANSYSVPSRPANPKPSYYYVTPAAAPSVATNPAPKLSSPKQLPAVSISPVILQTTTNTTAEIAAELEHLKKQAAEGNAFAQYSLAIYYLYGTHGLNKDEQRARMLLEMSAIQGNSSAKQKLQELDAVSSDSAQKDNKTAVIPKQ